MLRSLSILSLMAMGLFVVGCSSEKGDVDSDLD